MAIKNRKNLVKMVALYEKKLAAIYEGEASIDRQVAMLEEDAITAEEALGLVSYSESHFLYVEDHINKIVGKHGTYGFKDMAENSRNQRKAFRPTRKNSFIWSSYIRHFWMASRSRTCRKRREKTRMLLAARK